MANKAFYDGEMETLRLAIIDCISKQQNFMSSQAIYLVLHPLAEEMKTMYQTELAEFFKERLAAERLAAEKASNDPPTSPISGGSSSV